MKGSGNGHSEQCGVRAIGTNLGGGAYLLLSPFMGQTQLKYHSMQKKTVMNR